MKMPHLRSLLLVVLIGLPTACFGTFFSGTSFKRADVAKWADVFQTCRTIVGDFFIPIYDSGPPVQLHNVFLPKIPTPISLVKFQNVTLEDRPLFFNAKPPTRDYHLSYYMNRTGYLFFPSVIDPQNNFKTLDQIDLSHVRAVTLSINEEAKSRTTEFHGLGEEDSETNTKRRYNEVMFQFRSAVFLGADGSNPATFTSHLLPGNKKYPMEIYLYFDKSDCILPECFVQLVVLVEESKEDNKEVQLLLDTIYKPDDPHSLFNEEVKFLNRYNALGLDEFTKSVYDFNDPATKTKWFEFYGYSERLHLAQRYIALGVEFEDRFRTTRRSDRAIRKVYFENVPFLGDYVYYMLQTKEFSDQNVALDLVNDIIIAYKNIYRKIDEMKKDGITTEDEDAYKLDFQLGLGFLTTEYEYMERRIDRLLTALKDVKEAVEDLGPRLITRRLEWETYTAPGLDQQPEELANFSAPFMRSDFSRSSIIDLKVAVLAYISYQTEVVIPVSREFVLLRYVNDITPYPLTQQTDRLTTDIRKYKQEKDKPGVFAYPKQVDIEIKARNSVPRVKLDKEFQISWLIPQVGGRYEYTGSTPFPPCHVVATTLVFEKPISMSRQQIQILTRVPTSDKPKEDITNTRPPFHVLGAGQVVDIKYNLKNHQWLGVGDGKHENSLVRARKKRGESGGDKKTLVGTGFALTIITIVFNY